MRFTTNLLIWVPTVVREVFQLMQQLKDLFFVSHSPYTQPNRILEKQVNYLSAHHATAALRKEFEDCMRPVGLAKGHRLPAAAQHDRQTIEREAAQDSWLSVLYP